MTSIGNGWFITRYYRAYLQIAISQICGIISITTADSSFSGWPAASEAVAQHSWDPIRECFAWIATRISKLHQ